jgi:hypothetical protein
LSGGDAGGKKTDLTPAEVEKLIIETANVYTTNWRFYQKNVRVISFKRALNERFKPDDRTKMKGKSQ